MPRPATKSPSPTMPTPRSLRSLALLVLLALWIPGRVVSAQPAAEDPAHTELRTLKQALVAAIEKGDIDALLPHVHPEVVVTWQNGEVCRGPAEMRGFFERMASGSGRTWQGFIKPPTPDALTTLHAGGLAGVVTGDNIGRYHLLGREIALPNRWTATVVKTETGWKLAAYHISMNVLDNPLLNGVRKGVYIAGFSGLVAGLGVGWMLARRKRRTATAG